MPERGVNAIVKMAGVVEALDGEFRRVLLEKGGVDEWLGYFSAKSKHRKAFIRNKQATCLCDAGDDRIDV